jgi:CHAD domain-containing protein
MAAISISPNTNAGFDLWMERVRERIDRVQPGWDPDDVHDLRVALRRCRSMADALSEVNPSPRWRKVKRNSRELFKALGALRDIQIERLNAKKFSVAGEPSRRTFLRALSLEEHKRRDDAIRSLDRFDRKSWKLLARKLSDDADFFPQGSVVFQRLALARLTEAMDRYRKAKQSRASASWHRLRIALKNFRYLVENFLPQRYEAWASDLKQMQDLLGELHDLDVLRQDVRKRSQKLAPTAVAQWLEKIDVKRKSLVRQFVEKSAKHDSPWLAWRATFQWGHPLAATPVAERRTA